MEILPLHHPYCHRLREIPQPPSQLYVLGNPSLLGAFGIAVVGTRRPSYYGVQSGFRFGRDLASRGFVVVSGLARGVDTAAHQGALAAGGMTIAVLGHGLDRVYPARNRELADLIVKNGGCLVSEYPPGVAPLPHHFPARNRIIAGLSLGTLVVEAAARSGSLITAHHALEQGRDVFVVPGRIDADHFDGGHRLIQDGAKLVKDAADILWEYPWLEKTTLVEPRVTDWLAQYREPITFGELQAHSGKNIDELEAELEEALRTGNLIETAPQTYLFVGKEESFHPAPCQN